MFSSLFPALRWRSIACAFSCFSSFPQRLSGMSSTSPTAALPETEVVVALGSNMGDRWKNLTSAVIALNAKGVRALYFSSLYESAAAYVVNQPSFLNAAVLAVTVLSPLDLLKVLKEIEHDSGRDLVSGMVWGPRPVDLDIIAYGAHKVKEDILEIPHKRWQERDFVKVCVAEIAQADPNLPGRLGRGSGSVKGFCDAARKIWAEEKGESRIGTEGLKRVSPLGSSLEGGKAKIEVRPTGYSTLVMGILNITPDSFSDGGVNLDVKAAVGNAKKMIGDGADIIDLGGQSTRPGATYLSPEEEASRVLPVIRSLSENLQSSKALISVDTFHSSVAKEAVLHGAHIINDVSGGSLDPDMFSVVASLGVPYICMHMRGTPQTMQTLTQYTDVCSDVASELQIQVEKAMQAGIPAWNIILDPGIGFAKSHDANVEMISNLASLRSRLSGSCRNMPLLVGVSRKGFLGTITGRKKAEQRDAASVAAAVPAIHGGAEIIRSHNVPFTRDLALVADAVYRSRFT